MRAVLHSPKDILSWAFLRNSHDLAKGAIMSTFGRLVRAHIKAETLVRLTAELIETVLWHRLSPRHHLARDNTPFSWVGDKPDTATDHEPARSLGAL